MQGNPPIREIAMRLLIGRMDEDFKFHLVNWAMVCTPTHEEGLGIQNLLVFSKALLGK